MEARLLEGLLGVERGGDEARVGGDQLEGGHAHLGGRRGLDPAAHLARVRVRVRVRCGWCAAGPRVRVRVRVRVSPPSRPA